MRYSVRVTEVRTYETSFTIEADNEALARQKTEENYTILRDYSREIHEVLFRSTDLQSSIVDTSRN